MIAVVMPYTQEEECWMKNQLYQMEAAFHSVPIGEELLKEFSMYSLGVPLSKSYMKNGLSMGMERVWRMLRIHQEFSNLTTLNQLDILACQGFAVLSVLLIKFSSFDTGIEQLRYAFSRYDEELWNESFKPVFEKTELKKLGVFESSYELPVLLTKQQQCQMSEMLESVSLLLKDPIVYGLIMLMTLSKHAQGPAMCPLANLNSNYSLLMKRRLLASEVFKSQDKLIDSFHHPEEIVNKVYSCLKHIEQMAGMIQMLSAARESCSGVLISASLSENLESMH